MASNNRLQLTIVEETTLGITPTTPRMRKKRFTGHGLKYTPTFSDSEERRDDGMRSDPILTGTDSNGPISFEFHYPFPNSPLDSDIKSGLRSTWTSSPAFDNDGTADSVITDAGTTANTFVVASGGAAVKLGHLVRSSGFTIAANNISGGFRVASSTATTIVGTALGLTAEAVPPGTARLKVVGFQGAAGDITATASGLASTLLDFTTLGLLPGMFLKIGGTAAGNKFATAAINDLVRISGTFTATAIPLDNLPTGWGVDAGAGKTIEVWFPDHIINGVTTLGQSIERGHMGQTTPVYILQKGMVVNQLSLEYQKKTPIKGTATYMGMAGTTGTVSQDSVPDVELSVPSYPVFSCSANIGRVGEAGALVAAPNFVTGFNWTIDWNSTPIETITDQGPVGIDQHSCNVTGRMETVFGDNSFNTKFFNGTVSSASLKQSKGSQMVVTQFPRITYDKDGSPTDSNNQTTMLPFGWTASKDTTLTNAMVIMDRFEYFE